MFDLPYIELDLDASKLIVLSSLFVDAETDIVCASECSTPSKAPVPPTIILPYLN